MNKTTILVACFTPLAAIWIVMKLALWLSETNKERKYVAGEKSELEGSLWRTHMQTLMKRKKNIQIAQIIDEALEEHYSELGLSVPNWKRCKEQWWIDYLISVGLDPNNP